MTGTNILVGLAIAVGLVGVVLPGLPGSLLVAGAILVWALEVGSTTGWVVFGVAVGFIMVGTVVKYAVPGRRMRRDGIATSTLVAGGVLGIVGFFVIPVAGLVIGFVLGIYLAEWRRLDSPERAWPSTVAALRAVGLAILIEFLACLAAAVTWAFGLLVV
ncbi:MAG: DUF456 domain-containing protein [Actinomycetota bacterium]|nr:DUF456 domain-containing protein [Actinomycetota bacterium]